LSISPLNRPGVTNPPPYIIPPSTVCITGGSANPCNAAGSNQGNQTCRTSKSTIINQMCLCTPDPSKPLINNIELSGVCQPPSNSSSSKWVIIPLGGLRDYDMNDDGSVIVFSAAGTQAPRYYYGVSPAIYINGFISNSPAPGIVFKSISCSATSSPTILLCYGKLLFYCYYSDKTNYTEIKNWYQITTLGDNVNLSKCTINPAGDKFLVYDENSKSINLSSDNGATWKNINNSNINISLNGWNGYLKIGTNLSSGISTIVISNYSSIYITTIPRGSNSISGWTNITPSGIRGNGVCMSQNGTYIITTVNNGFSICNTTLNNGTVNWVFIDVIAQMTSQNIYDSRFPTIAGCTIDNSGTNIMIAFLGWWIYGMNINGNNVSNIISYDNKYNIGGGDPNRWNAHVNYAKSNSNGTVKILGSWDTFSSLSIYKEICNTSYCGVNTTNCNLLNP